jgi:hypothetical protein
MASDRDSFIWRFRKLSQPPLSCRSLDALASTFPPLVALEGAGVAACVAAGVPAGTRGGGARAGHPTLALRRAPGHAQVLQGAAANRNDRGFGWEIAHAGRYATPAAFPRHDGTPYRGLRVRRDRLGFVYRSRAVFCRAVPNLSVSIRNFCIATRCCSGWAPPRRRRWRAASSSRPWRRRSRSCCPQTSPCWSSRCHPAISLASPSELLPSPSELFASPSELLASPTELLASPTELSASPIELVASPSKPLSVTQEALPATPSRLRRMFGSAPRVSISFSPRPASLPLSCFPHLSHPAACTGGPAENAGVRRARARQHAGARAATRPPGGASKHPY